MFRFVTLCLLGLATFHSVSATLAGPICPGSNMTTYTSYGRKVYNITCGADHRANPDIGSGTTNNFQACVELCANTANCVTSTFNGANGGANSGACYMKGAGSGAVSWDSTVNSAYYWYTLPALSCPDTDGQTFNINNGASAIMECYQDHSGGDAAMSIVSTMEACITLCSNTQGCVAASYAPGSGGLCYLKNNLTTAVTNYGVWGARMTSNSTATGGSFSASCPQSNDLTVTDNNNATFVIECGMDRPGGDYQQLSLPSLTACMSACSNQIGCVDVSWVPGMKGTCYLKNSLVTAVANPAVWGARLVANETIVPPTYSDWAQCSMSFVGGSSGCGIPYPSMFTPGNQGSLSKTLTITLADGQLRQYLMFLPINYNINVPASVIVSFHGQGEGAGSQAGRTGWQNNTLNKNTITIYPQGVNSAWQGAPYSTAGIDDISFVRQLVNYVNRNFCVDQTRIYATGQSNGAGFVGYLACDAVAGQIFAGFGASSGAFYSHIPANNSCPPQPNTNLDPLPFNIHYPCASYRKRIPFMEVHSLPDTQIPYNGGSHNNECMGAVPTFMNDFAARQNYSSGTTNVTTPLYNSTGQVMAYQYQWGTGATLGQTVHYMVPKGSHDWDDGVQFGQGFNTGLTMWNFLMQWTLFNA